MKKHNKNIDDKQVKVGMYGETPRIKIGKYTICEQTIPIGDTIWIEDDAGEGGEYRKDLVEVDIEEIFKKYY